MKTPLDWLVIIGLVILLGCAGCTVSEEEAIEAEQNIADAAIEVQVSAIQLAEDYEANELAANDKYDGKVLAVSGTVQNVSGGQDGEAIYVDLGTGSFAVTVVRCHFSASHRGEIITIRRGQRVTLKGMGDEAEDRDPFTIDVIGCSILDRPAPEPTSVPATDAAQTSTQNGATSSAAGESDVSTPSPQDEPAQSTASTPAPQPTSTQTATPAPTPTATPVPAGLLRSNPAPTGSSVTTEDGLAITILSVDEDATPTVLNENQFNDPPDEGHRFLIMRVRVQNVGGSVEEESKIAEYNFRLVGSSGVLLSTFENGCGYILDELDLKLFLGGTGQGNLCFQVAVSDSNLVLIHEPLFSVRSSERRWLEVGQPTEIEDLHEVDGSLVPSAGQEQGLYRANPVPPGTPVTTAEGLEIAIVSAELDATSTVMAGTRYRTPKENHRFLVIRLHVENINGSSEEETSISESDFLLVGSTGLLLSPIWHGCGVIPDEIDLELFRGGAGTGNVCFQAPSSESAFVLIYDPLFSYDRVDRRWLQVPE